MSQSPLIDRFGRKITYLRLSVTDRCDFRCVYCMAERMEFLPRSQVLTLEELGTIGRAFVELGTRKIRLTGGEPLVRNNVIELVRELGALPELGELTLTTNGSRLPLVGLDAIREFFGQAFAGLDWLVQINGITDIDIGADGKTATTSLALTETAEGVNGHIVMIGRYNDKLVLTRDGWKFEERRLTVYKFAPVSLPDRPA